MRLFRSEEDLRGWLEQGNLAGEKMSVERMWDLARAW